jgi:hypothetical protein
MVPEHRAQREAAMAASRSFVAMGRPFSGNVLPRTRHEAAFSASQYNAARRGPCRPNAIILVIMQEARDLVPCRSCLREVGQRSRVFEELPLDFGRKSTPPHDDGRSQTFEDFLVVPGSLIKFQIYLRLSNPLGAHLFRYSHTRIASSGLGGATFVVPPRNGGCVMAHIGLTVFS